MSKLLNVMVVFGTRPEAIKMAPVIKRLQQSPDKFKVTCVITAQHREMLDQVLQLMHIVPDVDLDIMQANQTLSGITTRILQRLDPVLEEHKPDVLLVQGDTSTAFVGGLCAYYHRIPVGHIEAGLRTDTPYDPFPEEMNRRMLTRIAALQFPPTVWARNNLLKEGISAEGMYLTGNTVTDALAAICRELPAGWPDELVQVAPGRRVLLVEAHRRENLGAPMAALCRALLRIVHDFADLELVFSVHRNPKVREVVMPALSGQERVHLLEPVAYPDLVRLMRGSYLILTDSGGIQEEAPSLGVPALVCRKTTERPEGVDSGNAILVGTDEEVIVREATRLLRDQVAYQSMSSKANPYGDGHAAERIEGALLHYFGLTSDRPEEFSL